MAFVASVGYIAASQTVVTLNTGSNPKCYYQHMRVVPGAGITTVTAVFDVRPGVNYVSGTGPSVWSIPLGARQVTITPAGGGAAVELGRDY